jgi:nucleotide-binding universal stress UspA family protein
VCGVDGSRGDRLAVEQSLALCEAGTSLLFVCARAEHGAGASRQASITAERADHALHEALESARESGVDAAMEILEGHDPRRLLLDEAAGSDLLVVASHGGSRAAGIAIGSTASAVVHRATVPVLVARSAPEGRAFPDRILVATDGSADAARAVELTGRIGRRHRSHVYLLSVEPEPHGDPKRIAVDAVNLTAELEREPTILRASGHAGDHIVEAAASTSVSLVVVGSRGLSGVRALGSVSERVAHRARCSVLVARPT